jgi:ribosomal protein L37E
MSAAIDRCNQMAKEAKRFIDRCPAPAVVEKPKRRSKPTRIIRCRRCGVDVLARAARREYCDQCGVIVGREARKKWCAENKDKLHAAMVRHNIELKRRRAAA